MKGTELERREEEDKLGLVNELSATKAGKLIQELAIYLAS